jgi:multidrug efflux pump subunit AcrB
MFARIRRCADLSIRRGCGFALLGIWAATVGMAYEALVAVRGGAVMLSLMTAILVLRAMRAPARNYRRTEVWILLDKRHGLPEHRAQGVIGGVLRDRYLWHAQATALGAFGLWLAVFLLSAFG